MKITVIPPQRGVPHGYKGLVLEQDLWNDFSYRTQYHVYYFGNEFEGFIGNVKILKRGQVEGSSDVLPVGTLEPLSEAYCSLGQSLDYYERLAQLSAEDRNAVLLGLRDALKYPDHAEKFVNERGWNTSIMRDSSSIAEYRSVAMVLVERDYSALASLGIEMSFRVRNWNKSLKISFAGNNSSEDTAGKRRLNTRLPERIAVITGENGSGKSTLLARLARVLHASPMERSRKSIRRLGKIEPKGIGFTRIIAVSYSAFDTFHVPGISRADKQQIASDLSVGAGRYVYCGLRDIGRELSELLDETIDKVNKRFSSVNEELGAFGRDRQVKTYLKSADTLADEFDVMIRRIKKHARMPLLQDILEILLSDASFADFADERPAAFLTSNPRAMFLTRSTGHKIVLHLIAALIAYVEPKSLILMDEPESHLHPPLLAALMHATRTILAAHDAFAIVATHSPVVAQETLGQHVAIVRRSGSITTILRPRIETYGESIGEITNAVFGLNTNVTDYHNVLDELVNAGMSQQQIEDLFERGLSFQARAYVMSRMADRDAQAGDEG
ncbi:AAA ATPase [Acetobacter nitrogenifigens DSM 23921 = NBRC 105050]|uniref:AAA+ ATPase domain-containing protein n=1 Tax=Acetobacter nitrogenifigens DSM 23921 = NBRC 105050 TaxID=1120919 RepID=A0A511X6I7_9PROT|nr:AAA family ATPase [Acetobacter nitrogenifigens]GBQ99035.1 AAA ATPase [Acetobacter nitrogenifigens DSM 23921 = NBRC 105050]GEN58568.1 hypothetical protein ANI02nite_04520 [Acetobacter nitrogenifigens DSM 23921 = NBRC 105050]